MTEQETFSGRFEPVGHCIYCGRRDRSLSLEHIVPFGLGGDLELPHASCSDCADITSNVERVCLRHTFMQVRARHRLPTRRPKERPNKFPITIHHPNGREIEKMIRSDELPQMSWGLPLYGLPGILLQVAPGESPLPKLLCSMSDADASALIEHGGGKASVSITFTSVRVDIFSRMLAKIGHAFAYALLGRDGFKPCLSPLILKGTPHYAFWVGGETEVPAPAPSLYKLGLSEWRTGNGLSFLGVGIRLFACLGTPQYGVIVGERIGDKFARLKHRAYEKAVKITFTDGEFPPSPPIAGV